MPKFLREGKGMSLVEVLGSLVLISIIIVSFLSLFGTSAKQNKTSEEVMDTTYIAQKYMEKITNYSMSAPYESALEDIKNKEINLVSFTQDGETTKLVIVDEYRLIIEIGSPTHEKTSTVIIKVFDKSSREIIRTEMQTIVWWRFEP